MASKIVKGLGWLAQKTKEEAGALADDIGEWYRKPETQQTIHDTEDRIKTGVQDLWDKAKYRKTGSVDPGAYDVEEIKLDKLGGSLDLDAQENWIKGGWKTPNLEYDSRLYREVYERTPEQNRRRLRDIEKEKEMYRERIDKLSEKDFEMMEYFGPAIDELEYEERFIKELGLGDSSKIIKGLGLGAIGAGLMANPEEADAGYGQLLVQAKRALRNLHDQLAQFKDAPHGGGKQEQQLINAIQAKEAEVERLNALVKGNVIQPTGAVKEPPVWGPYQGADTLQNLHQRYGDPKDFVNNPPKQMELDLQAPNEPTIEALRREEALRRQMEMNKNYPGDYEWD